MIQNLEPAAAAAESSLVSTPALVRRASVEHRPVQALPQAKADFGWLSESPWARIEPLGQAHITILVPIAYRLQS